MSKISPCPPEWDTKSLVEIARITTGRTPSTYNTKLYGNDYPFISPGDLGKSKFILTSEKMLSEIGWRGCKKFPRGAILFVCIGSTIGKLGVAATPVSANQQINGIVPNEGVAPDFLYYWLSLASKEVRAQASEQAVPIINKTTFGKLNVFLPSLQEQEAIAKALSDADALIEGLERLIAKKQLIKQGAMQELLTGRHRLPGYSREWIETTFEQCFLFLGTGSASRSQLGTNLGVGYIHYGDIHGMKSPVLDLSRTQLPEIAPKQVAQLPRVQNGDLVVADASEDLIDVGKSVEVRALGNRNVVAGLHTFLLRGNPEIVANGFKAYIQFLPDVRVGIDSIATGSSVYGISKKNLAGLRFRVPAIDEQSAIGQLFFDMDAEIQALESRLEKTRSVKEGMMQNLLTGRIRLV